VLVITGSTAAGDGAADPADPGDATAGATTAPDALGDFDGSLGGPADRPLPHAAAMIATTPHAQRVTAAL
jgi:hypothetical protein